MARSLPARPSLRYLHEEAKDLLRAHRRRDPAVCPALRRLRRFADASEQDILSVDLALADVQFALALDYGFKSWEELARHVKAAQEAVLFKDPRSSRMQFNGDPRRHDSFSLAVTAALRGLGLPAEYDKVYILSCNPFAPDLRPDEPTRCHWQLQGRELCLDLIAAAFGLAVRPFPNNHDLADIPPKPKDPKAEEVWLREYYAKPAASYLSHALQSGEVVVSAGEWAFGPGLNPDVTWCDWGVVVEARQDGTILGAAANGRLDNLITHVRDGWIQRMAGEPLPPEAMYPRVLRRAVQRIRGENPPFGPGSRKIAFGVAAMDAWIAAMNGVPFDFEQWQGVDRSSDCARQTALPVFEGTKASARFLAMLAEQSLQKAATPLRDAANQYERIASLLAPGLEPSGEGSYSAIMGDLARQRAHVAKTLQPVRECLAQAAECLERALNTMHG